MSTPKPSKEKAVERPPETMAGLAKGLAIVEMFDGKRTRLTAAEAARATGISRATARRCLLTLAELGYVARHEDGQYFTPRSRLLKLSRGYSRPVSFIEGAQPLLDEARDKLLEPVSLTVLDGAEAVFVARAVTARIVTTGVYVGGRLPVYCSATGRAMVCEMPGKELEALLARGEREKRTPKTVIDINALIGLIAAVREAGVAYSDEEIELGMRSMAVPVRDANGRVRAAVSVSTSSARVSLQEMKDRYQPVLMEYAGQLTELLRSLGPDVEIPVS